MLAIEILTRPSAEQLGAIARLYAETGWWADAEAQLDLVERLIQGSTFFCVAHQAGEIVGMGRVISDGVSDAFIHDVAVTAARRGEGIATRMVKILVEKTQQRGIDWIGLIAKGRADGVYRRCGFRPMDDATAMRHKDR